MEEQVNIDTEAKSVPEKKQRKPRRKKSVASETAVAPS